MLGYSQLSLTYPADQVFCNKLKPPMRIYALKDLFRMPIQN